MGTTYRGPWWPAALCIGGLGLSAFGVFGLLDRLALGYYSCTGECGPSPVPDPGFMLACNVIGGILLAVGGILGWRSFPRGWRRLARATVNLVLAGGVAAFAATLFWPYFVGLARPDDWFYVYLPVLAAGASVLLAEGAWLWTEASNPAAWKVRAKTR